MMAHLPEFTQTLKLVTSVPENTPVLLGYHMDGEKPVICDCAKDRLPAIEAKFANKRLSGKEGECYELEPGLFIVSMGQVKKHSLERCQKAMESALSQLMWAPQVAIRFNSFLREGDCPFVATQALGTYALNLLTPRVLIKKENPEKSALQTILWVARSEEQKDNLEEAARNAEGIAYAMSVTRRLGDLPSNICTPTFMGETALALGKEFPSLEVTVLGLEEIKALGMGSFLSVAKGSVEPPRFIAIRYNGGEANEAPMAFVGKGITFDSGGISLKPGANMWNMIFDMCGAASVMGLMAGVAKLGVKKNVLGVIATCENMPSGHATKPGDVVTSLSGKTIEILNTDAEGRLILADALTWTLQQNPKLIVDMATLTGACVIALGSPYSGLFSEDETLTGQLVKAGKMGLDRAWPMPTGEAYLELMKSPVADISNLSSKPEGGACTAAAFLQAFTEETVPWAHLDIAATANDSGPKRYATGRPVPLLMNFVLAQQGYKSGH